MPSEESHTHFNGILDFGPIPGTVIGETFTEVGFLGKWTVYFACKRNNLRPKGMFTISLILFPQKVESTCSSLGTGEP